MGKLLSRYVWFALMASVSGGCSSPGLDVRDADGTPSDGSPADGPSGDGGLADGLGEGGPASGNDPWIYVATEKGVDRVNVDGGAFVPFGISADTLSVFSSPTGTWVAQELADQRVAVFAADGTPRATFDAPTGLLGWSDDGTLLFFDQQTRHLQQTSVDGQTRRDLPLPPGLHVTGYLTVQVSPDRGLLAVQADPFGTDQVLGFYLLVLSAVDGALIRDLGVHQDIGAWTGDSRLVVRGSSAGDFVVLTPRSGESTPVTGASALNGNCSFVSWYETGRILLGKLVTTDDTGHCVPSVTFDVDAGSSSPFTAGYLGSSRTSGLVAPPFAQSADGREAAVLGAGIFYLELGAVAGGERRTLGSARGHIIGVSWAHPIGGP